MNDRSVLERLQNARNHAMEAHGIASTMGFSLFKEVDHYQHAVRSHLIIVGEAIGRLPKPILLDEPNIPWLRITGMRHRLVHAYWRVDLGIVYHAARHETPDLVQRLERLIERLG